MTETIDALPQRPRLSLDVDSAFLEQVRRAAADHEVTVRQYVLTAIEERLRLDHAARPAEPLTAATDPLLADLWDNPNDAAYDRPSPR